MSGRRVSLIEVYAKRDAGEGIPFLRSVSGGR